MGFRIAVLTGKNIKANCPNTFGPCTSTGFPELFLLICLSMGVLILTIIQSRFTVITFPIKSSYDADQFFKTQLGVKLGGLSSLLDVTQHCSLAVLSLSPEINPFFYFFFCHAALKEINILWSIGKKKKHRHPPAHTIPGRFFVFKSVLSRKETIWYCCAPRYPPWYRSTKVSSNVLNTVLIMHLEHLALWPFILKSHYSSGLHGYKALSALFFYYILIALDGGKGRTWTST